ncbi:protein stum-like [Musca vetustissima]|uniref:protein stum-like n=1 Tax=Musca vetustissima TaxID=27455 RepID=UPI002AB63722|nr:protein stum-like [Musca vetustissima]
MNPSSSSPSFSSPQQQQSLFHTNNNNSRPPSQRSSSGSQRETPSIIPLDYNYQVMAPSALRPQTGRYPTHLPSRSSTRQSSNPEVDVDTEIEPAFNSLFGDPIPPPPPDDFLGSGFVSPAFLRSTSVELTSDEDQLLSQVPQTQRLFPQVPYTSLRGRRFSNISTPSPRNFEILPSAIPRLKPPDIQILPNSSGDSSSGHQNSPNYMLLTPSEMLRASSGYEPTGSEDIVELKETYTISDNRTLREYSEASSIRKSSTPAIREKEDQEAKGPSPDALMPRQFSNESYSSGEWFRQASLEYPEFNKMPTLRPSSKNVMSIKRDEMPLRSPVAAMINDSSSSGAEERLMSSTQVLDEPSVSLDGLRPPLRPPSPSPSCLRSLEESPSLILTPREYIKQRRKSEGDSPLPPLPPPPIPPQPHLLAEDPTEPETPLQRQRSPVILKDSITTGGDYRVEQSRLHKKTSFTILNEKPLPMSSQSPRYQRTRELSSPSLIPGRSKAPNTPQKSPMQRKSLSSTQLKLPQLMPPLAEMTVEDSPRPSVQFDMSGRYSPSKLPTQKGILHQRESATTTSKRRPSTLLGESMEPTSKSKPHMKSMEALPMITDPYRTSIPRLNRSALDLRPEKAVFPPGALPRPIKPNPNPTRKQKGLLKVLNHEEILARIPSKSNWASMEDLTTEAAGKPLLSPLHGEKTRRRSSSTSPSRRSSTQTTSDRRSSNLSSVTTSDFSFRRPSISGAGGKPQASSTPQTPRRRKSIFQPPSPQSMRRKSSSSSSVANLTTTGRPLRTKIAKPTPLSPIIGTPNKDSSSAQSPTHAMRMGMVGPPSDSLSDSNSRRDSLSKIPVRSQTNSRASSRLEMQESRAASRSGSPMKEIGDDSMDMPGGMIDYGGAQPGSRSGSRAAEYGGAQAGSRSGSRAAEYIGAQPGSRSGSRVADYSGPQPGSRSGSRAADYTGAQPGSRSGSRAADYTGAHPGSRSGSRAAEYGGAQPGSRSGSRAAEYGGAQPGSRSGSRASQYGGAQPASRSGSRVSLYAGAQPEEGSDTRVDSRSHSRAEEMGQARRESRAGSRLDERSQSRIASRTGSRVGSRSTSRAGSRAASRAESRSHSRSQSRAPSRSTSRASTRPISLPGSRPQSRMDLAKEIANSRSNSRLSMHSVQRGGGSISPQGQRKSSSKSPAGGRRKSISVSPKRSTPRRSASRRSSISPQRAKSKSRSRSRSKSRTSPERFSRSRIPVSHKDERRSSQKRKPPIPSTDIRRTSSIKGKSAAGKPQTSAKKTPTSVRKAEAGARRTPSSVRKPVGASKKETPTAARKSETRKPAIPKREPSNLSKKPAGPATLKKREPSSMNLKKKPGEGKPGTTTGTKKTDATNKKQTGAQAAAASSSKSEMSSSQAMAKPSKSDMASTFVVQKNGEPTAATATATAAVAAADVATLSALKRQPSSMSLMRVSSKISLLGKKRSDSNLSKKTLDLIVPQTPGKANEKRGKSTTPSPTKQLLDESGSPLPAASILEKSQKTLENIQKTVTEATEEIQKTISENLTDLRSFEQDMGLTSDSGASPTPSITTVVEKKPAGDKSTGESVSRLGTAEDPNAQAGQKSPMPPTQPIEASVSVLNAGDASQMTPTQMSGGSVDSSSHHADISKASTAAAGPAATGPGTSERVSERSAISVMPEVECESANLQNYDVISGEPDANVMSAAVDSGKPTSGADSADDDYAAEAKRRSPDGQGGSHGGSGKGYAPLAANERYISQKLHVRVPSKNH